MTGDSAEPVSSEHLLRLAGFAGLGVGIFILPFAVSDGVIGGLFAIEVLHGADAEGWLQRIGAHPDLARVAIALPIAGFPLMLVVGLALYRLVAAAHWAGTLGLMGYLVGVPLAVGAFVSATSLVWRALGADFVATLPQAMPPVTSELHRFMLVNMTVGPLFIVVVGHTSMAVAARRTALLPRWLCAWGFVNGAVMLAGTLVIWWPAFEFMQIGGPLSMLWVMTVGAVLLRRSSGRARPLPLVSSLASADSI
jgi:hypothetical protein